MKNGQPNKYDIDPDRLDEQWCGQPGLYHAAAVRLADARQAHAEAKAALDVTEAELSLAVRRDPQDPAWRLDKATEASVAAAVLTQPGYRKALQAVIEAKHAVDVLEADVWALDHRKKGLENMVQLRLADYYSEPRKPRDVSKEDVRRLESDAQRKQLARRQAERRQ